MKIRILLFIAWCICTPALAQQDNYRFTHLDINAGLSHNQVTCFLKDSRGFLWIGTMSGLNRYDGYKLRIFRHDLRDTASLADNYIAKLFEDGQGNIWVNTPMGLTIYNPETESFSRNALPYLKKHGLGESVIDIVSSRHGSVFVQPNLGLVLEGKDGASYQVKPGREEGLISPAPISMVSEDPTGNIFIIHRNGIIEMMDRKSLRVVSRTDFISKQFGSELLDYNMTVDSDGDAWVFSNSRDQGVFYYKPKSNAWYQLTTSSSRWRLNNNIVRCITQDDRGVVWIGTDHGGINLIKKKSDSTTYVLHNDEDAKSVAQNSITTLYKDRDGMVWAGTFKKGVSYYHENVIRFQTYKHVASDPFSLRFEDVNRFAEDDKGNLWIGTNGGGLIYFDRAHATFKQFVNDPHDPTSLSNNVIVSLLIDRDKRLWIGTYYGGLNSFDGKKFTRYKHDPANPQSLSDDSVWEIYQDSQGNIWLGTLSNGMDLFDPEKNVFSHYRVGQVNSVHSNYISALTEDSNGNLWIGTATGIDMLEKKSGRFLHFEVQANQAGSLSNNGILCILEDYRGRIWIGTTEGLNLFDPAHQSFRTFREEDGLPHNTILTILEDKGGDLWMSTPNGLSCMKADGQGFHFKNFDESDGLQGKQFNENAAFKTRKGELLFGGANGFNVFKTESIGINRSVPKVILSDFQVFNKSVRIGEEVDGEVILNKSITSTSEITLSHNQNVISIEFAALGFFHSEKNEYKYMLEGFNKDWLLTDGRSRKVTYTNLDPGEYVFKVKASNNDGLWNEEGASLKITIRSPFWKTTWAFALYAFVICGGLFLSRKLTLARIRQKFKLEEERREAYRMHELDMMKIKFFTNVSHEFRTPLTLILTPLEKLIRNAAEPEQENQFHMIHRNARRLLNLVNQLLDFRRMEVKEVRFNPSEGDIIRFLRDVVASFTDLSEKKDIRFSFQANVETLETFFDQDKLERILFNLLSNAFKFTPSHGTISVEVNLLDPQENASDLRSLQIKVKDTGIGIPVEKQEQIFDRFFQSQTPSSIVNQGSGIGLSIAREFVGIHGGTISVASELEKGSCFTIVLPVKQLAGEIALQMVEEEVRPVSVMRYYEKEIERNESKKPLVLLVEDNEDFRFYLKDNLREFYAVIEAQNGKVGWHQTLSQIPDLIVSDVMMPEVNGIELCKKIKSDPRTSHIPVILLTARSSEEQKLEGFETGANDFIGKPFNFEILLSRIRNLIVQQELLRKAFQKHIGVKASEIEVASLDEKLIQKAVNYVEKNISDPDFSVEELSRELGMSRVYLYKKLLSLTGKTPLEFIRVIRLQRAAQLLEKSQLTVAEVAYQVGFNNPKYFARYFKMEFDVLPSAYHRKA